jgi:CubicO group peptidase (beta-lactamase class C family)
VAAGSDIACDLSINCRRRVINIKPQSKAKIPETMSYKSGTFCRKFIFLTSLVLMLQSAAAQDFSGVQDVMEKRKNEFGGKMSVLVWKDTTVFQKVIGEDFNLNTQAPVGCGSAWFTAAVVMTLVDQGKIQLDDPVSKYLPIFATYAKSYLTIRHCLANTTGIEPDKGGVQKFFQKTKFETLEEEVNSFAKREIKNNPGEVFYYNNIGTNIAARVVEVVSKRSFERLASERIFRPLGMKRTRFVSEAGAINPFSGAESTAGDYLKFLAMLLNKGTLGTKKVLSPSSVDEMQKIQTGQAQILFVPKQTEGSSYGLGNWIMHNVHNGMYASPALSGGWPYINTQKKYGAIIFGDARDKEDKKDVYLEIVNELESLF